MYRIRIRFQSDLVLHFHTLTVSPLSLDDLP